MPIGPVDCVSKCYEHLAGALDVDAELGQPCLRGGRPPP
jgi:hypothetical protein